MGNPPWKIYAEQLAPVGFGYPLWAPDPPPGTNPVELGDVGWVRRGEFVALFNACRAADDRQPLNAVPSGYEPLDPSTLVTRGPRESIRQEVLHSRSIKQLDVSSGAGAGSPLQASVGVDFQFQCRDDSGALLKLDPPSAMSHDILSEAHVEEYVHKNLDSWLAFANSRGLGLKEKDIRFVCGTIKAVRWTVAAFHGSYRNKTGKLSSALGAIPVSAHLAVKISDESLPAKFYRAGPPERLRAAVPSGETKPAISAGTSDAEQTSQVSNLSLEVHDQCIFFNSVKRKTLRDKFRVLRLRGGGPTNIPTQQPIGVAFKFASRAKNIVNKTFKHGGVGSGDREGTPPVHGAESTNTCDHDGDPDDRGNAETVDVLDYLLDYILDNSKATSAIASDVEVYKLLADMVGRV
ncbi:hypothetical protein PYCCODRAFT_1471329 [Trametes coccinea BRFM310]|uniref:Uncharacterized protein n=1 Tax=Trametes coccinea (strain BRFM310) TaxID=1353009 RepID=A0A1Y2IAH2_TRAC3|nr:hypothetical protein PYCCODRAFT_1471329 [Trametes coccinea BRFM310]